MRIPGPTPPLAIDSALLSEIPLKPSHQSDASNTLSVSIPKKESTACRAPPARQDGKREWGERECGKGRRRKGMQDERQLATEGDSYLLVSKTSNWAQGRHLPGRQKRHPKFAPLGRSQGVIHSDWRATHGAKKP